jgi:hypothetical protein
VCGMDVLFDLNVVVLLLVVVEMTIVVVVVKLLRCDVFIR